MGEYCLYEWRIYARSGGNKRRPPTNRVITSPQISHSMEYGMRRLILSFVFLCLSSLVRAVSSTQGYYRFPALHKETILFTAHGDLWKVSAKGGIAQALTTHPAEETHAAISPDGQWIAFSASYEGPTEAYIMSMDGGLPARLTY